MIKINDNKGNKVNVYMVRGKILEKTINPKSKPNPN